VPPRLGTAFGLATTHLRATPPRLAQVTLNVNSPACNKVLIEKEFIPDSAGSGKALTGRRSREKPVVWLLLNWGTPRNCPGE